MAGMTKEWLIDDYGWLFRPALYFPYDTALFWPARKPVTVRRAYRKCVAPKPQAKLVMITVVRRSDKCCISRYSGRAGAFGFGGKGRASLVVNSTGNMFCEGMK